MSQTVDGPGTTESQEGFTRAFPAPRRSTWIWARVFAWPPAGCRALQRRATAWYNDTWGPRGGGGCGKGSCRCAALGIPRARRRQGMPPAWPSELSSAVRHAGNLRVWHAD